MNAEPATNGSTPMSVKRVTVEGASSVCSVDSTRWPVCAACIAILRGLLIADFAHENDVGILAEDRPQGARKRQLDLVVDLRLIDPWHLVLDGIFDRDDVRVLCFQRRQRRAQRRRLAAARGTDDQNHPVLVTQEEPELFESGRRKPELFERRNALAVIEHAQHDLFAEHRAQRRGTEVDFGPLLGSDANAAVLRQPLFRDVHPGHDLQAGDQTLVHPLGQVHDLFQQDRRDDAARARPFRAARCARRWHGCESRCARQDRRDR